MNRACVFAVGPQHLLTLRHVARLAGGGPAALHQKPWLDAGLAADQAREIRARLIVTDHRDKRHGRAQSPQIAHHVARAARNGDFAVNIEHRNRGLAADALDRAIDVAVQHGVADDKHRTVGEASNRHRKLGISCLAMGGGGRRT